MENKNPDAEITEYSSSDIYFSSYLCALGYELKHTERDEKDKKKVIFVFDIPKKDLNKIKTDFFGGSGTVKVQKFVQALRSLKSVCFL